MEEINQYIEQESRCWERSLTRRLEEVEVFNEDGESQLSQGRRENGSEDAEDIQSVQNQMLELAIEDELLDCHEAEPSRVRSDINQVFVSKNVVNLSTRNLSHAEVKVLSKGLNFWPTAKEIDKYKLAQDLAEFSRKIKCRAYFKDKPLSEIDVEGLTGLSKFREKSTWYPSKVDPALETFLNALQDKDLGDIPEGAILCTMDAVGLYPHIPHLDGLSSMRRSNEDFRKKC
ncbi:Hypothetical predicted protein, partial [Paramuricea clavata]